MRRLVLVVLAEFMVLVALAVVWLTRAATTAAGQSAAGPQPRIEGTAAATPASVPAPTAASATPSQRGEVAPAEAQLTPGDPIGILVSGRVRSTDGTPVEGASVSLSRDGEYRGGDSAATGSFAVAGLQPGTWQLSCRAEGFASHQTSQTLDQRAFQQIDIELRPSWVVQVKLQGDDGKSLLDALSQSGSFDLPYVVATDTPLTEDLPITDQARLLRFGLGEWRGAGDIGQNDKRLREQGYFGELRMDRPPPAHAALLLRTTLLRSQRIDAGQKELVFTMTAADVLAKFGTVKLRLLDAVTGEPIRGAGVRLSTAQGGGTFGKSSDDGRVTIEHALPGLGCLEWSMKDREALFRYVRVPSGGVADLGDIRVGPALQLSGVVVDADGKPANGATVQWTELDCRTFPQPLVYRRSSTADAEGRFALWACGRHRYVVFARTRDGRQGFATLDASSGAPAPLTITLGQPTKVALRTQADLRLGYLVTALARDRSPVAVATLGSEYRPESFTLLPGSYTVEIHDLQSSRLVRSFALEVGDQPVSIEVP